MDKAEIIEQLEYLKEHCLCMVGDINNDNGDDDIWSKDVKALEEAIKIINSKAKSD